MWLFYLFILCLLLHWAFIFWIQQIVLPNTQNVFMHLSRASVVLWFCCLQFLRWKNYSNMWKRLKIFWKVVSLVHYNQTVLNWILIGSLCKYFRSRESRITRNLCRNRSETWEMDQNYQLWVLDNIANNFLFADIFVQLFELHSNRLKRWCISINLSHVVRRSIGSLQL